RAAPAVCRRPACDSDPESDLGERLVTVAVGALTREEVMAALARGAAAAEAMRAAGLVEAVALFLRGEAEMVGGAALAIPRLSPSGLTRRSIVPQHRTSPEGTAAGRAMDCRDKPGNDSFRKLGESRARGA